MLTNFTKWGLYFFLEHIGFFVYERFFCPQVCPLILVLYKEKISALGCGWINVLSNFVTPVLWGDLRGGGAYELPPILTFTCACRDGAEGQSEKNLAKHFRRSLTFHYNFWKPGVLGPLIPFITWLNVLCKIKTSMTNFSFVLVALRKCGSVAWKCSREIL